VSVFPRRSGRARQTPVIRRASAGLPAGRIAAAVVIVALVGALYGVMSSSAFTMRRLDVSGVLFTSRDAVFAAMGLGPNDHPNVFTLSTRRLRSALLALPAVADADVRVSLPDRVAVTLQERPPILVWAAAGRRWLVDADGIVLADAATAPAAISAGLPVFSDDRSGRTPLAVGGRLDPLDLTVARRLGGLTPRELGSHASSLSFGVTDQEGFAIEAPDRWHAVFGIYTATLRSPDLIPAQVQCLNSLMGTQGEGNLATIYLFPEGDRCGTFVARTKKP